MPMTRSGVRDLAEPLQQPPDNYIFVQGVSLRQDSASSPALLGRAFGRGDR